jgi:hypothetical protein
MSNITKYLLIAPLLAACTQTDAEPPPRRDAVVAPDAADLARPQPELPICGHCSSDLGLPAIPNDDELSMSINAEYVGAIEDVVLFVYTATGKYAVNFNQSVIDDLNNPSTSETIVMLDIPNAEVGVLEFSLDDNSVWYEPITVEQ